LSAEAGGSVEQDPALGTEGISHGVSPFARALARIGQVLDDYLGEGPDSMYGTAGQKFKIDSSGDPAEFPLKWRLFTCEVRELEEQGR